MSYVALRSVLSRAIRAGSVAALAATFSATVASAEELVMSSWLPPAHPIVTGVITPWAKQVADVTEGRVTVRILPSPLGPPPAHFDLAADGIADLTYGLHSFTTDDRFLRSRLGQFSFLGDTAEATSMAYWNVYGGDLDAQAEHEGTKLLGLFVHGPGMFHNNQRPIDTPQDFEGLKIRVPGGYIAELMEELGVTTQFMGPGDVFEKLSTRVIDGVTFPAEALKSFNLSQHLSDVLTVPGGFYNTSWFLVMNEEKWDGISQADRTAIEAISGAALAATAGKAWDAADAAGMADAKEHSLNIQSANDAVLARISEIASAKEAEWAEKVAAQGFDGAAALAAIRKQAKK
ncbi:MAG: TRAP transporter substrate-binding protein [Rhodobiaceae bacterium]|nr:TRAP transporter substrate-binding protein [Rhodobiaceae bacterium]MCC0049827.1 TRAP transporter substrate-binding protein [Rhodobiaceae bacterium]